MNSETRKLKPVVLIIVVGVAIILLVGIVWAFTGFVGKNRDPDAGYTHEVEMRDLDIAVTESGSIVSTHPKEIRSKLDGRQTILSLIAEGAVITQKDVDEGRILVKFEDETLVEKTTQQEITFQSAQADYTQAKESYGIQKNQNESNIRAGELAVKFARMDFQRCLGAALADRILDEKLELAIVSLGEVSTAEAAETLAKAHLGGSMQQEWKKLQSAIDLAEENELRADTEYEWSKELGPKDPKDPASKGKGYISKSDVEADRLKLKVRAADAAQARLAMDIFLRYDLPKQAEKLYSDYFEAQQELERSEAKARAELAQADSRQKSREARFNLQKGRLEKLKEQIINCTIRAESGYTGMIVYASTTDRRGRAQDTIEVGATVRKDQIIIRIPDPSDLSIKVKVNEAYVSQVRPGQKVRIIPESSQDKVMWGTVKKVASTPAPQHWSRSLDSRSYTVTISLDESAPSLKSGMTAEATILMNRLENVIAVPVQAVSNLKGINVCYVVNNNNATAQPVEIGRANDTFIEITSGIKVGDQVLLAEPTVFDKRAVLAMAEQRKVAAEEAQRTAIRAASEFKPPETTEPEVETAAGDVPAWIKRIPEERRDRALQRWKSATPKERMKQRGAGGGRRFGRGRPGGERSGNRGRQAQE